MNTDLLTSIQAEAIELVQRTSAQRIVVWGAGELGNWLMVELKERGIAFVDSNPTKLGSKIANRAVHAVDSLDNLDFDEVWIAVLSDSAGICKRLRDANIPHRLPFPSGKSLQVQHELPRKLEFLRPYEFGGKHLLEVGCGGQLYLALTLLHLGAESVRVCDVGAMGEVLLERKPEWLAFLHHLECLEPRGQDPERILSRIQIESGGVDAASLDFQDASFDGIVNTGVMEHVDDPAGALSEFVRVLRPGGLLLCLAIGIHDHRANDPKADFTPWSFLSIEKAAWRDLGGGAYHQNRWRSVDFVRCSERVGLQVLAAEVVQDERLTAKEVECFAPEFKQHYSLQELSELDLFLAAIAA